MFRRFKIRFASLFGLINQVPMLFAWRGQTHRSTPHDHSLTPDHQPTTDREICFSTEEDF
jgi:hypothetical protein